MKISTIIENVNNRYRVQIATGCFTALEQEKLAEFGDPIVDVGSVISGSATRPGVTNTTVTITGISGGTGATGTVQISPAGAITGVTITSGGTGYTSGATCVFNGDGTGATGVVTVASGVVTGVSITNSGAGYNLAPYPLTFTLKPAPRRMHWDFPVVQIFDLNDYLDADLRAQIYANVITARLITAKASLVAQVSDFAGETVVTV